MGGGSDFKGCMTTHGPWGSSEGTEWDYKLQGFIRKIIINHAEAVDYIQFQSDCTNCETQSAVFGEPSSSSSTHTICIDYPNEYLVALSGTYGSYDDNEVVKSICFRTNLNLYGPYGTNTGTAFSYDAEGGVIVGFHGRASSYLNAIGVYVTLKSKGDVMNELSPRMAMPREAGPWGAGGGLPWDDGVFSAIRKVRVHLGEQNAVYALQFEYLKSDGKYVLSQIHGGTDGTKLELIDLDGEDEFLTGISGFFGTVKGYDGLEAITSISFHTNKRIHGPFGEEKGAGYVSFSSAASLGKIVGFQGRTNGFLSAIGVHMEYF